MAATRAVLPGSERIPLPGALVAGPVPADHPITVSLYVRRNPYSAVPPAETYAAPRLADRRYLTHEEAASVFGAHEADLDAVRRFAEAYELHVVARPEAGTRRLTLAGAALAMQRAFDAPLAFYEHDGGRYRGRTGGLSVPSALDGIVVGVLGLDDRRVGRSYLRRAPIASDTTAAALPPNTYLPPAVARLYDFPAALDGTGQCVGILVCNGQVGSAGPVARGGYDPQVVRAYFERVLGQAGPAITDVVVAGPGNSPGSGEDELDVTGEVLLDVCVVGSVAPGARLAMYFTDSTERGWVDAIATAVADRVNRPSVFSCGYGSSEDDPRQGLWTPMAVDLMDEAFRRGAAQGMTVICASGDSGTSGEPGVHADYPASSAWVTGCGGTSLVSSSGRIVREAVWNDAAAGGASGGGVSALFRVPDYQSAAGLNPECAGESSHHGRGVPDVAALADPRTPLVVPGPDGQLDGVGGTGAAAAMWSALAARLNQGLAQPVGFFNPTLYGHLSAGALRDIVHGDNGAYHARPGWDACTGLGRPVGSRILEALQE